MTVTTEQAKAMLDAATPGPWWEDAYGLYGAGKVAVIMGPHPPSDADAHLIAAAPDLAATVVELHERLASVEAERDELQDQVLTVQTSSAYDLGHQHGELTGGKWKRERDKLARWKAEAKIVIAGWNQVWEDAGRPGALGESTSVATAKHIAALQAAIDKVQAILDAEGDAPISRLHKARVALTQGGKG